MDAPTLPAQGSLRVITFRAPYDAAVTLNEDFCYTAVTDEAAASVGMTPGALIGRRIWDVFPDYGESPVGALLRDVMRTRIPSEIRTNAVDRTGTDILVRVVPTIDGGIRAAFRFVTRVEMSQRPATALRSMTGTR